MNFSSPKAFQYVVDIFQLRKNVCSFRLNLGRLSGRGQLEWDRKLALFSAFELLNFTTSYVISADSTFTPS